MENFNNLIIVDSDKEVMVPECLRDAIVQYDHNVLDIFIDVPRYWYGKDLYGCYFAINFTPLEEKPDEDLAPVPCTNILEQSPDDENAIRMTWTITNDLSKYKGKFKFLICAKTEDEEGNEELHWNSKLCYDMRVGEGLEGDVKEEYGNI